MKFASKQLGWGKIAGVICVLALLSSCASLQVRKTHSGLPLEIHPSNFAFVHANAWESSDYLFVSGSIKKRFGIHHPGGAIIRVDIVDKKGVVIRTAQDSVPPADSGIDLFGRSKTSFVVRFPLEEAKRAAGIRLALFWSRDS